MQFGRIATASWPGTSIRKGWSLRPKSSVLPPARPIMVGRGPWRNRPEPRGNGADGLMDATLADILSLERIGDGRYRGRGVDLGRRTAFGGLVVGQALAAG